MCLGEVASQERGGLICSMYVFKRSYRRVIVVGYSCPKKLSVLQTQAANL